MAKLYPSFLNIIGISLPLSNEYIFEADDRIDRHHFHSY